MNYTYCGTTSTIYFCTILLNITKITSNAPFASGELQRKKIVISDSNYMVTRIIDLIIIYRLDRKKMFILNAHKWCDSVLNYRSHRKFLSVLGLAEFIVLGNYFLRFINSMTYFHTNLTFVEIWPLSSKLSFLDNIYVL